MAVETQNHVDDMVNSIEVIEEMKIATYNIWNSHIYKREEQLIKIINDIDADFIGLQEVTSAFYEKLIANAKYPHHAYSAQDMNMGDSDFVAVLSKHPICEHFTLVGSYEHGNINAHSAIFEVDGIRYSFTNSSSSLGFSFGKRAAYRGHTKIYP